jgi:hypothetical protein
VEGFNMVEKIKKILIGAIILIIVGVLGFGITSSMVFLSMVWISLLVFGLIIYFLPTIVAYDKEHENKQIILLVNFLFGWTLVGWIGCIIWACINKEAKKIENNSNKYDDLAKLQKLKENGVITDVEFEIEKQKLLK